MQMVSPTEQSVQQVRNYDIFMDIDFTGLAYSGRVTVDLDTAGDVNLDAVGLKIKSVKRGNAALPFRHNGKTLEIQTGKFKGSLDVEFSGKVSDNFTGLYKASFGEGYILSTHLEAVSARKVFPCLDHPAYKAVFKLTVVTSPDLKVISNMPILSEETRAGRKVVAFDKTPKMST